MYLQFLSRVYKASLVDTYTQPPGPTSANLPEHLSNKIAAIGSKQHFEGAISHFGAPLKMSHAPENMTPCAIGDDPTNLIGGVFFGDDRLCSACNKKMSLAPEDEKIYLQAMLRLVNARLEPTQLPEGVIKEEVDETLYYSTTMGNLLEGEKQIKMRLLMPTCLPSDVPLSDDERSELDRYVEAVQKDLEGKIGRLSDAEFAIKSLGAHLRKAYRRQYNIAKLTAFISVASKLIGYHYIHLLVDQPTPNSLFVLLPVINIGRRALFCVTVLTIMLVISISIFEKLGLIFSLIKRVLPFLPLSASTNPCAIGVNIMEVSLLMEAALFAFKFCQQYTPFPQDPSSANQAKQIPV